MQSAYLLETIGGAPQDDTSQNIANLLAELSLQQRPKLLLHAHGGLVDANNARVEALGMDATFRTLSGWSRGYFIWHTDFWEQITKGLAGYKDDPLAQRVHAHIRAWAHERASVDAGAADESEPEIAEPEEIEARLRAAGEADAAGAPLEDHIAAEIERRLQGDPLFLELCDKIDRIARGEPSTGSDIGPAAEAWRHLDPEVQAVIRERATTPGQMSARSIVSSRAGLAALRVILRFLRKRDHGLQATVVEEILRLFYLALIGARIWQNMKDDAAAHVDQIGGAGSLILKGLDAIAASGKTVELVIIGHSAGSILALNLLKAVKTLSKNIKVSLIFWAAAATQKFTADTLDQVATARISHFAMLSLKDKVEKDDALDNVVPGNPYPRSLLYLISGVLEPDVGLVPHPDAPLMGLERHRLLSDKRLTSPEKAARAKLGKSLAAFVNFAWTCNCPHDCSNVTHGSFGRDHLVHQTAKRLIEGQFAALPACPGAPWPQLP